MLKFKLRMELEHTHKIIIDATENLQPEHVYYCNIQFASAHNGKWALGANIQQGEKKVAQNDRQ